MNFCSGQIFHDNLVAHEKEISETVNVQGWNQSVCWNYYADKDHWVSILQNSWVRPEDIHNYRKYFSMAKLATRMHDNPRKVIQAYVEETFIGSLLELFEPGHGPIFMPYVIDNTRFPKNWFKKTTTCDKKCQKCGFLMRLPKMKDELKKEKEKEKKKFAEKLLRENKSVRTVLEKIRGFKGRLRKQKTKFVAGEKTKEVLYRENGCIFRFNVDSTYFSPRLSSERAEISGKIKRNENVLVMFSGINPYGIVIARNSPAGKVTSIEINREAGRYAKLNSKLNKVEDKVQVIQGGVKRLAAYSHSQIGKNYVDKKTNQMVNIKNQRNRRVLASRLNLQEIPKKYDVIVMPRPQLKESFLKEAFFLSKKGTVWPLQLLGTVRSGAT